MTARGYSRNIQFDKILNFRDLGGYKAKGGHTTAWRRLFRSGEMHLMTSSDATRLKEEIKLKTVIDLRGSRRVEQTGIGLLDKIPIHYHHVPLTLVTDVAYEKIKAQQRAFSNMGDVYLYRIRQKEYGQHIIEALEIIAEKANYPLVFHCNAGKDRSGALAAILLSVLGVADEDIIGDYTLSAPYIKEFIARWDNDPATADIHKNLPYYHQLAAPEAMGSFLASLKKEYGSAEGYVKTMGAGDSLINTLKKALLV